MANDNEDIRSILTRMEEKLNTFSTKEDIAELKTEIGKLRSDLESKEIKISSLELRITQQEEEIQKLKLEVPNRLAPASPKLPVCVDLYLFGSSEIAHVEVDPLNPGGNNRKMCIRGGKIGDFRKEIFTALEEYEIHEMVWQFGTNNTDTESPQYIAFQLQKLAMEVKLKSPHTHIYIGDILPRRFNDDEATDFEIFRHIHRKLRGASKDGNFVLITNYQFWRKDGDIYVQNTKLFTKRDFVHPNFAGVGFLQDNFMYRHSCAKFQQNPEDNPTKLPQVNPVMPVPNQNDPTNNAIRVNPGVPRPAMLSPVPFTPIVARHSGINTSTAYRNIRNNTYTRQRRVSF